MRHMNESLTLRRTYDCYAVCQVSHLAIFSAECWVLSAVLSQHS
jgi:hypothetical protein